MDTHRDGKEVVVCDGCYQPIANFDPHMHNVSRKNRCEPKRHACSTACVRKIKAQVIKWRCPRCVVLDKETCNHKRPKVKAA